MRSKKHFGKLGRWAVRLSAGTAVMSVIFVSAVFRPVDWSDWAKSDSLMSAREIVTVVPGELAKADESDLEAGWASAPLTVKVGEPLAGYGARRGDSSTGKGEVLWARALCLRSGSSEVVLVTADILLVHAGVSAAVEKVCSAQGISPESLYFTATHTHCGPGGWGPNIIEESVCGEFDPTSVERIARDLSGVILEARKRASPAEWSWIRTEAPEFLRNRTVDGGTIDPVLEAIAVRQKEDGQIGLFAFFGAHATCLGVEQMAYHADYPGVFVRVIEGGDVNFAAFGAASVGSQSPVGPGEKEERATAIGTGLAEKLLFELETAEWKSTMHLGASQKLIPLPEFQVRVSSNIRVAEWIANGIHPTSAPIQFVRLDQHRLVGLPVEFSSLLSAPLRAEAATKGLHLTPTVFNGDYIGYVLPPEIYDSGAYETQMNFLGPGGGAWFSDLIRLGIGIDEGE